MYDMKGLIVLLIIGFILSLFKNKKEVSADKTKGKVNSLGDFADLFGFQEEQQKEDKDCSFSNQEEIYNIDVVNDFLQADRTNNVEAGSSMKVNQKRQTANDNDKKSQEGFDVRKAIIYSSILDRPYK